MFFRRKGKLRKIKDQELWDLMSTTKDEWMNNKGMAEKSVEPTMELLLDLKVSEAKYFYLVRETKIRKQRIEEGE